MGVILSSLRSISPCSKNSLATRLATSHWISHGLVMAATSHAVIIIPRRSSRWSSCHQSYVLADTKSKKDPRLLLNPNPVQFSQSLCFAYNKSSTPAISIPIWKNKILAHHISSDWIRFHSIKPFEFDQQNWFKCFRFSQLLFRSTCRFKDSFWIIELRIVLSFINDILNDVSMIPWDSLAFLGFYFAILSSDSTMQLSCANVINCLVPVELVKTYVNIRWRK